MMLRVVSKARFRIMAIGVMALVLAVSWVPAAQGYYEYAPVDVRLSASEVTVVAGSTTTVSCAVSPESEEQLPGCGMEQCPQTCGEGCLDEDGWCTCAGLTPELYTTEVTVTSGALSVARATYAAGVLKVTGVAAGTTTLTITAKLSKHQDATAVVRVQVTEPAVGAGSGSEGGAGSDGQKPARQKPAKTGEGTVKVKSATTGSDGVKGAHTGSGVVAAEVEQPTSATATEDAEGGSKHADGSTGPAAEALTSADLSQAATSILARLDVGAAYEVRDSEEPRVSTVPVLAVALLLVAGVVGYRLRLRRALLLRKSPEAVTREVAGD